MRDAPGKRYVYELPQLIEGLSTAEVLEGRADEEDVLVRVQLAEGASVPRYWVEFVVAGQRFYTRMPLTSPELHQQPCVGGLETSDRAFTLFVWTVKEAPPHPWPAHKRKSVAPLWMLGFREREVLRLLREGLAYAEVGAVFKASVERIRQLEASARQKVEARVGAEALQKALDDDFEERQAWG